MKRNIKYLIILLFLLTIICIYEVNISYNNLTTTNYSITTNQINNKVNLIIISDLHDNKFKGNNEELVKIIKSQSPDAVLVVGDMINDNSINSNIVINFLKQLGEIVPVYYSLGNTEEDYIKARTSDLIKELEDINITVLDNQYKDIKIKDSNIRIGGMYEYAFGLSHDNKTYDFLSDFQDTDNYKIMMSHRPDSFIFGDASKVWDIDLVVSGHNHGGQVVLPFFGGLYGGDQGWFPEYDKGLFDLDKIKILITSGLGSGKEKLPRFNNVPEVVNLQLTSK
ncbi:metallophosphoesterase [Terrisporobacter vanillatitrophus]|uniref:metallophosphoesterase n=1 Tax=Terrisporobacter vanillatitrophus TaxID=3058402 RepID=UPI0033683BC8